MSNQEHLRHMQTLQNLTPDQSKALAAFKAVESLNAALMTISRGIKFEPINNYASSSLNLFRSVVLNKKGEMFGINLNVEDGAISNVIDYAAKLYRSKSGNFYPAQYVFINSMICKIVEIPLFIDGAAIDSFELDNDKTKKELLETMKRGALAAVNAARNNPFGSMVSVRCASR